MWNIPDLGWIINFAIIGMILSAVALLGGVAWLVWFVINHVRIV